MQTVLEEEGDERNAVRGFFQDAGKHQRTVTNGVRRNDAEGNLPGQGRTDEAVIERWMGERWRIFAADETEHEVKGRDDEQAPDPSEPEDYFCEFHKVLRSMAGGF